MLVVLCVLVIAITAIAAHAAVFSVNVQDMSTLTCEPAVVPPTSTSTTTTSTTVPPGGCGATTRVVCPKNADNHDKDNDGTCDGNNGIGNG